MVNGVLGQEIVLFPRPLEKEIKERQNLLSYSSKCLNLF